MPLLYPDLLVHSNPNNALVDSNFIKGATRSAVSTLTDLYQLSAKGEAGSLGQLKSFATRVWVASEGKYFTLTNEASARNANGWATDNQMLSAVLNSGALDTTSKFVSASDGNLTANYLTKAINANGINESIVYDDGARVGIGETSPEGRLHVTAGSAGTVTAQPSSVGVFESDGNAYISLLSPTSKYAGVVMGGPTNPYGSYLSWNHDNLDLKLATNHAGADIQFLVNAEQHAMRITSAGNVGIGTSAPNEKLTVNGNLSASGTATIGTINTNSTGTSVVIESSGLLQKRTLNTAAFDTASKFVSASDGTLTTNYLTKATNSNGINESIISDNGTLVYVGGNLTISGNLTALGNSYFANTLFTTTCAISVVNNGPGPALYVYQGPGTSDVASFYDGDGVEVLHVGNCDPGQQFGKIGINTGDPNRELTVKGSVSATGSLNVSTINTNDASTSFVVLGTDNILQKRAINIAATNTTSRFVSASDGALTINRLTKATDSNGINESIVTDDGSLVSVGGNLSTTGTATIGTLATGTVDSVLVESSGLIQKRTIDSRAWGSSLVDGTGTANRVAYWTDPNTIAADNDFFFDGTKVGIGEVNPLGKLSIYDSTASDITLQYGSNQLWWFTANADNLLKIGGVGVSRPSAGAINITGSGNIGIGTATPGVKLDVNGVIRSNNEIIGDGLGGSGQARYISGNYGIIHRNDGSDYYILKTASGDQYGGWDASRPFAINLATGNVGIGSVADISHKLTVTGNIKSTNVIIPGSSTVTPAATTALPSCNDVILNNQTGPVTITAFSGGVAGVTYTITNKSAHAVTLDTSASLFVRGGNSWASHKCTTNSEGYIVLPQNFSCSLRMDSATIGSAW